MAKKTSKNMSFRQKLDAFDARNRQRVINSSPRQLYVRSLIIGLTYALILALLDMMLDTKQSTRFYFVAGLIFSSFMFITTIVERKFYLSNNSKKGKK